MASCVTLQTQHIRDTFVRFPEVILIDATHDTNVSKYKVISFMAHDVFGRGLYVQHAVIQNERAKTLRTAINAFKDNNPDWVKIQYVLIDKDFTEMSVLRAALPSARILLCQFHVIKWLREEVAADAYGLSAWKKERQRGLIDLLVYATNWLSRLCDRPATRRRSWSSRLCDRLATCAPV